MSSKTLLIYLLILVGVLAACSSLYEPKSNFAVQSNNLKIDTTALFLDELQIQNEQLKQALDTLDLFSDNDSIKVENISFPLLNYLIIECKNGSDTLFLTKVSNESHVLGPYGYSDLQGIYLQDETTMIRILMLGNEEEFDRYFTSKGKLNQVNTFALKFDNRNFEFPLYNIHWRFNRDTTSGEFINYKLFVDTVDLFVR